MILQQEDLLLLKELKQKVKAQRVFLFGSIAKQQQHALSDIDAMFVIDTSIAFHRRTHLVMDWYDGRLPLEPLIYTPKEFEDMRDRVSMQEMLKGAIEV